MPQIGAQTLTESDMWGATPFDQLLCRIAFKGMRYDGVYTVPGTDLALNFPGSLGGMNWGGFSTDPTTNTIFVNDMRLGLWIQMKEAAPTTAVASGSEATNTVMGVVPMKGTPYAVDKNRFLSALGIPCQEPPFGSLTAIDMNTQQIKWQVPLGTVEDTGPMGIKMGVPIPIGMRRSVARLPPRAASSSSQPPRTITCVPSIRRPARKSGKPACLSAARVLR